MSANTKIVVLRMKQLICTGVIGLLSILCLILLLILFVPGKENDSSSDNRMGLDNDAISSTMAEPTGLYIPGVYNTHLSLDQQSVNVEVIVNSSEITSIRLTDVSSDVENMYPLLTPTLEALTTQILEKQSLSEVTYDAESKYTSLVLLQAIDRALQTAKGEEP